MINYYNMDFKRWKFSEQAQPELQEFLKAVERSQNRRHQSENSLLNVILPKLPDSFYEIDKANQERQEINDCIILDDDDNEEEELPEFKLITANLNESDIPDISEINLTLSNHRRNSNEINLTVYTNYLKECLNEGKLLEDDIKKISSELNVKLTEKLLRSLSENVTDSGLLELGKSLNNYQLSSEIVMKEYCKIILFKKLVQAETSKIFMPVADNFIRNYSHIIREEVLLPLINNHLDYINIFDDIFGLLPQNEKEVLIREFLFSCNELQERHLKLLQPLIGLISEFSAKQRIISLMAVSADKFTDNKLYMKLLIEIIKTLDNNYLDQEPVLYGIIEKNKTIFKLSAEKALNTWFNNYSSD